jgi:hypothetical protein
MEGYVLLDSADNVPSLLSVEWKQTYINQVNTL